MWSLKSSHCWFSSQTLPIVILACFSAMLGVGRARNNGFPLEITQSRQHSSVVQHDAGLSSTWFFSLSRLTLQICTHFPEMVS